METEQIKAGFAGAGMGAFALFGIGFGVIGWVFGGTAQQQTETAIIERLTPICITQAKQDSAFSQKLKTLEKLEYDKRGSFVATRAGRQCPAKRGRMPWSPRNAAMTLPASAFSA